MIKHTLLMVTFLTLLAAAAPAASPQASTEGPAVSEVLVFDVGPNFPKFMQIAQHANVITQKYGSTGKARIWGAAYAGAESGRVIVVVEYPSLVSLAQSAAKVEPSPEWQQLVAEAQASSIKVVSDSIVVEVKAPM